MAVMPNAEVSVPLPVFSEAGTIAAYEAARVPDFFYNTYTAVGLHSMALQAMVDRIKKRTLSSDASFVGNTGEPLTSEWVANAQATGSMIAFVALQNAFGPSFPSIGERSALGYDAKIRRWPYKLDEDFDITYGAMPSSELPRNIVAAERYPHVIALVNRFSNDYIRRGAKTMFAVHGMWAYPGQSSIFPGLDVIIGEEPTRPSGQQRARVRQEKVQRRRQGLR
jgi:hypothetical protein